MDYHAHQLLKKILFLPGWIWLNEQQTSQNLPKYHNVSRAFHVLLHSTLSRNEGLIEASRQRCQEVREEYPELGPFFDALVGFEVLASELKLREMWHETAEGILPDFREFVDFLLSIGLVGLAELKRKSKATVLLRFTPMVSTCTVGEGNTRKTRAAQKP